MLRLSALSGSGRPICLTERIPGLACLIDAAGYNGLAFKGLPAAGRTEQHPAPPFGSKTPGKRDIWPSGIRDCRKNQKALPALQPMREIFERTNQLLQD